ncbi:MAG: zeta toxin family protein [Acidimicrobiales bacterium]
MSRLDLVVGPNGAGKSTFVRLVLAPTWPTAAFVTAALIAARIWPDHLELHAYEAAALAAATRSRLIELRRPLIAETVFSHPSKLDLIDEAAMAGYYVALHVLMVSEDLAVARVAYRKAGGGHGVPVGKIRQRYRRLWAHVAKAVPKANSATFWDNSQHAGPRQAAMFIDGLVVGSSEWPGWAPADLTIRWPT